MAVYDVVVVGAGLVGLAAAYQIVQQQPQSRLLVLEKEGEVACHQSGHNSGVIHSGIYYRPGSLKATTCRRGYQLLSHWCQRHDLNYEICGKIIVATQSQELPYLEVLHERGKANGLQGIKSLSAAEIKEYEPHAQGLAGLHVPQTGIVDFRQLAKSLQHQCEQTGVEFGFNQQVRAIHQERAGLVIETGLEHFQTRCLVSCGGLYSDQLARKSKADPGVRIIPFRGEYYTLKAEKRGLIRNLLYPVPDPAFPFLGVHFTRMIGGEVEAGPNAVLALKREGYGKWDFSAAESWQTLSWPGFRQVARRYWRAGLAEMYRSASKAAFVQALQRLLPEITAADLRSGGAGVRAQACSREGQLLDDFFFVEDERCLHVCNAPSPAATASLAIGEHIAARLCAKL